MDVDVQFAGTTRHFLYEEASSIERQQILRIVDELCVSPDPDGRRKFTLESRELLYHDGNYWILYRMLNAYTIQNHGIGTVGDSGVT